ncbi:hypothetical protein V6N13_014703 [Hibiscus sabdariffa]
MVETTAAMVVSSESTKDAEETSKGWEEHRAELEDRMTNTETRLEENVSKLDTNNSLLEKMLKILAEKEEEQSHTPVKKNTSQFPDFDPFGQGSSGGEGIVMKMEELGGKLGLQTEQLGIEEGHQKSIGKLDEMKRDWRLITDEGYDVQQTQARGGKPNCRSI